MLIINQNVSDLVYKMVLKDVFGEFLYSGYVNLKNQPHGIGRMIRENEITEG